METTEPTTTATATHLDFVRRALYGSLDYAITGRWRGALTLAPSAMTRLASILGWIAGVADGDVAETLAGDILRWLDYLDGYGGRRDDGATRYVVELGDDGCFASFSIMWFARIAESEAEKIDEAADAEGKDRPGWTARLERREWAYGPRTHRALFAFNGGLIYHGPGCGETFTVRIGETRRPWSIHT